MIPCCPDCKSPNVELEAVDGDGNEYWECLDCGCAYVTDEDLTFTDYDED